MTDGRYERGWESLKQINGPAAERLFAELADIAPDLGRWVVEFAFGDVVGRPGLDARTRELATVAALTAQGQWPRELRAHIAGALNVGATRQEVVEVILQMAVYAGFPAAINGIRAAKEVFAERER
jgi:4-carboxymuconolactone decarboxylase